MNVIGPKGGIPAVSFGMFTYLKEYPKVGRAVKDTKRLSRSTLNL